MPSSTRRLFFALWPDEALRAQLIARRERLGSVSRRRVPDANLHLTLLFLGDQPVKRLPEIQATASDMAIPRVDLILDRFGWFPGARVVWLGGEAPPALRYFESELRARLEAIGLALERRPFRPHVTLFRKVSPPPELPEVAPLRWPVREIALVESIPARPYQVLRTWPVDWASEA